MLFAKVDFVLYDGEKNEREGNRKHPEVAAYIIESFEISSEYQKREGEREHKSERKRRDDGRIKNHFCDVNRDIAGFKVTFLFHFQ